MHTVQLPDVRLDLFDGAAEGTGNGAAGGEQSAPSADRKEEGRKGSPTGSDTPEEKRKRFRELVGGEYKDVYTEETQRIIDRRFKEFKTLQERLERSEPILKLMMERRGIPDGDLDALAAALKEDAAPDREKQEALRRERERLLRLQLQRQGRDSALRQVKQWVDEAGQLGSLYPDFDLRKEAKDPQFLALLRSGIPVRHAYEVLHMEQIKAGVAKQAAETAEKQVVEAIRAKGTRPAENGTAAQSAFTIKDDVSKLTRKDRAEIVRRVQMGDREIRF